ncbi:nucleotide-diphospho-sugar transferase [Aspergillus keveii]|uniref:Nucleotide-diphospho-sugar transferase n=1 Tax=Aspergillus keveii TaxID=714993 RepID=A0ABR4FVS6_9EURO
MTVSEKAGHLILQTTRRKSPVFILLALILLIIIYPFRSTLLPTTATSSIANPTDPLTSEPNPDSQPLTSEFKESPTLPARTLLTRPLSHDKTTIPKLIHQTWFPAGSNMSESAQTWVATMKHHYSDWEYVLWDDESNEALVREHFPWFLETYKSLPKEINRADMARNFYMFLFGGMYADVDTEALRPIDPLFASHEVSLASHLHTLSSTTSPGTGKPQVQRAFMGRMAHTLDPEGLGAIPNGWMASPPGHPFWLLPVLSVLENPKGDGSVEGMTGPGILGPLIKQRQSWNIVLCTLNWIFWSNLTILFNKWILEYTPFTILLTTWHLLFATLATQLLAHTTPLLSARKSFPMNTRIYMARIAPIGLLYSASLVCSNVAYVYLNVGFIQMLKAAGPVVTLLTSYLWSVTELTAGKVVNILVIAVSVGVTVSGEMRFSWVGVALQAAALVCDANRLGKMDPLVSLYYTAPICFVMNALLAWKAEVQPLLIAQLQERSTSPATSSSLGLGDIILETGLSTLFANALVGFLLNVAVFTLIGKTSGLTMTLVSIPKNILLIGASVMLWGTRVSLVQAIGYAVALGGLVVYSGGGLVIWGWRAWKRIKGTERRRGRYVEVARKEEGERLV